MTRQRMGVPMEVQELHTTVGILSNEVQRLNDEKKLITDEIVRYEGTLSKYKEQQVLLEELLDHVETKKVLINSLNDDIDSLSIKKNGLGKDIDGLEELIIKKDSLTTEIKKLSGDISILQSNMETFANQHALRMSGAEKDYQDMKLKIVSLHAGLKNIIAQYQ